MAYQTPVLDPTIQKFVDHLLASKGTPVYRLAPKIARSHLEIAQGFSVHPSGVDENIVKISAGGDDFNIAVVRPEDTQGPTPAILYFHGGGWVVGDRYTHARLVWDIARASGATVLFVEYGLSPEHKFPVAIDQAYAALEYVCAHSGDFGIDPNRIFVAGDSSGANLATVACLLVDQRHGPTIMGQLLFYPTVSAAMDTASYQEFAEGPWLTRRSMDWFWTQYLPESTDRTNPLVSPLCASVNELRGFPPTLLITGECDVLRDEGEAYARKLMDAGVEVTMARFGGAIHDFMMLNAIADSAPTRAAIALAGEFIRRVSGIEIPHPQEGHTPPKAREEVREGSNENT